MAVQLASAYMQIIPSMQGFQGTVSKELAGVAGAGAKAGESIGTGMSSSIRGRLFSAIPGAGAGVGNLFGGSLLGTVKKFAGPIAGVVAGLVSVEAIKKSMEVFEKTAASTRSLQRTIGGSVQSVSGFVAAMQLSGVQSDKAGTALRIFSKNVGLAGGDSKKAAKLNDELGFSFKNAHGQILPMSELLPKVADKFQKMPDGAQKTALAMQLFGKSGTELLPFLNKGSAGIAELTAQATKMGLVLDDTSVNIFAASRKSARDFGAALQGVGVSAGQDFTVALDGIANVGRAALIPVFGALSRVFVALRPQFIAIGEAGDSIAKKLGAQLAPIVNRLADEFIKFVQKADVKKWTEDVAGGINRVVGAFGGLSGGGIVSSLGGIAKGFSPLQAVLQAIGPILPQVISALTQAATTVGPILATLATNVVAFLSPLITSKAGILALLAVFVGFKVVSGIITAVGLAIRIASIAQVAWNIAMAANPIGIIIVAIVALVAGLVWFFTQTKLGKAIWQNFMNFLVQAWHNIVAVAQVVWRAITTTITGQINIVRGIVTAVVNFIVAIWRANWTLMRTVITTVWNAIVGFVRGYINTVRSIITAVVTFIVAVWRTNWFLIRAVITTVWNAISSFVSGAVNRVRAVIVAVVTAIVSMWRAEWNAIRAVVSTVWNAIVGFVTAGINTARSIISSVLSAIVGFFSSTWARVIGIISSAWSGIVSAVSSGVSRVMGFVSGLGSQIMSVVSGFGSTLFSAGQAMIQGLIDGIGSMVGGAVGAVQNVVGAVANFLPHSPAKEGPFSGKGWTLYSGQAIGKALGDGMLSTTGHVRGAASALAGSAQLQTQAQVRLNASAVGAAGSVGGAASARPIVMDGNLFGYFQQLANGEARIVLNLDQHQRKVAAAAGAR